MWLTFFRGTQKMVFCGTVRNQNRFELQYIFWKRKLVTNILQNIFFCIPHKNVIRAWHDMRRSKWQKLPFFGGLNLKVNQIAHRSLTLNVLSGFSAAPKGHLILANDFLPRPAHFFAAAKDQKHSVILIHMRVRFRSNQRRNNKTDQGCYLTKSQSPNRPNILASICLMSFLNRPQKMSTKLPSHLPTDHIMQPVILSHFIDDGPVVTFALFKALSQLSAHLLLELDHGQTWRIMTLHVQGLRGHTFLFIPLQRVHAIHVPVIHPAVLEGKVAAVLGQATYCW